MVFLQYGPSCAQLISPESKGAGGKQEVNLQTYFIQVLLITEGAGVHVTPLMPILTVL